MIHFLPGSLCLLLQMRLLINVIFRIVMFIAFATRIFGHFRNGLISWADGIIYYDSIIPITIGIKGFGSGWTGGSWLVFSTNV